MYYIVSFYSHCIMVQNYKYGNNTKRNITCSFKESLQPCLCFWVYWMLCILWWQKEFRCIKPCLFVQLSLINHKRFNLDGNKTKTTLLDCNLFKNLQRCSTWFKSFASQLVVLYSRYNAVVLHASELLAGVKVHIILNLTLYGEKWCSSCCSYSTARGKYTQYLQDGTMSGLHR